MLGKLKSVLKISGNDNVNDNQGAEAQKEPELSASEKEFKEFSTSVSEELKAVGVPKSFVDFSDCGNAERDSQVPVWVFLSPKSFTN